jgi:signal transduction histidine kinase
VKPTDSTGAQRAALPPMTLDVHTEKIVEQLEQRLRLLDSPLLAIADVHGQLTSQVRSVLTGLAGRLAPPVAPAPARAEPAAVALSAEIGAARATAGVHPRDSLRAAALLYEVALPVVLRELPEQSKEAAQAVALALNSEVMGRVSMAAVPYVSLLLQRMHTCQFDERRRIARDLHDGVAHAVGVAMQKLEMYEAHLGSNPEDALPWLSAARGALVEALTVIRGLSAELGSSPTEGGLDTALTRYLDANVPPAVNAKLVSSGGVGQIPPDISDQLYFVIREAVRNALLHADTTELQVRLNVTDNAVTAAVEDLGRGLDMSAAMEALYRADSGTGLTSMRERVELLGGMFMLTTPPGGGTSIEIVVPLATLR